MKKIMKAILIDATNKIVSLIDFDGELDTIYKHLNCSCFDITGLGAVGGKNQIGYVDDEGLYSQEFGFEMNGRTFAGNMLIVSDDGEGGNCGTTITRPTMLEKLIHWITKEEFPEPSMTFISFSAGGNPNNN